MAAGDPCLSCGAILPADAAPSRKYCGHACRDRAWKRTMRARQRAARGPQLRPLPSVLDGLVTRLDGHPTSALRCAACRAEVGHVLAGGAIVALDRSPRILLQLDERGRVRLAAECGICGIFVQPVLPARPGG